MPLLTLIGRTYCHLCYDMELAVRPLAEEFGVDLELVDADADPHLDALRYEPAPALSSGADGLDAIRIIASNAPAHLHRGGWLLLEHGWDQGDAVRALLQAAGFDSVETRRDLEHRDRVTLGRRTD